MLGSVDQLTTKLLFDNCIQSFAIFTFESFLVGFLVMAKCGLNSSDGQVTTTKYQVGSQESKIVKSCKEAIFYKITRFRHCIENVNDNQCDQ